MRCLFREFGRRRLTWYLYLSFGIRASVTCTPVSLKHHHAGSVRQLLGLALRRQKKPIHSGRSAIFLFNIDRDSAVLGRPGKRHHYMNWPVQVRRTYYIPRARKYHAQRTRVKVIRNPSVPNLDDVEEDREPDLSRMKAQNAVASIRI